MDGRSRWRIAFLLSVLLHAGALLAFNAAVPFLFPKERSAQMVEVELMSDSNVNYLGSGGGTGYAGAGGAGNTGAGDVVYTGGAQPVLDSAASGEDIDAPVIETASDVPVAEKNGAISGTAKSSEDAVKEIAEKEKASGGGSFDPYSILINSGSGGPSLGRSAKLLHAEYPAAGTATYKGRVNISACIGTDGKIRYAEVVHSSGSALVDAIAMNCAKKWIYRPATDKNGKPIECNALISIPFREKKEK